MSRILNRPSLARSTVLGLSVLATVALAAACSSSSDGSSSPAAAAGAASSTAAAGGASSAASSSSAAPKSLQTVKYVLEWVPNPDFTGLYYGIEHGYFAKQGLKVDLSVNTNGGIPALLATNKDDLGNGYIEGQVAAKIQGLPVTSVAPFMPGTTSALIISGKAGVSTIQGLAGKTVGYYNKTTLLNLQYLLKQNGVDPKKVKTVSLGDSLIQPIVSGKVDAIMGGLTNVEAIQIGQEMKAPPVVFSLPAAGYPKFPEFTIMANSKRLKSDPEYAAMVKKFITAYVQGTQAAMKDVPGSVALLKTKTEYKPDFLTQSVPVSLKALAPPAGDTWGCFNPSEMKTIVDFYAKTGITTGEADSAEIFTNAYSPFTCPS